MSTMEELLAADEPLPDGLYFGLDAEPYHAHPALGSGDVKRCFTNPAEFWWKSKMNPMRPADTDSVAMEFGRAVHALVLEGKEVFDRQYERWPEGEYLRTDDDLKKWLEERGHAPAKGLKAARVAQVLALDPGALIEEAIKARAEAAGRRLLAGESYDRIMVSGALIKADPDLEEAFEGGEPEVSVFWTENVDGKPVRCKARFDYLKIRAIADLKSTGNPKELDFEQLVGIRFAERRMDIQAGHYMRAREVLPALVDAGAVYGEHDPEWLARVAAAPEYAFAHVFFQSTGAPSSLGRWLSPGNPILDQGHDDRVLGLRRFAQCHATYGTGMWLPRSPAREWSIDDLPGWFGRR